MNKPKKYGQEVMTDEECILFMQVCLENGMEPEEALMDLKMIDNLFLVKRNWIAVHPQIKKTPAGFYRKNVSLYDCYDSVLNARMNNNL